MTENKTVEKVETKDCAAGSCGCKGKLRWLPHNWLGLKAIAIINLVLFYVAFLVTLGQFIYYWYYALTFDGPIPYGRALWDSSVNLVTGLLIAIFFLMIAKALRMLIKIKRAVVVK